MLKYTEIPLILGLLHLNPSIIFFSQFKAETLVHLSAITPKVKGVKMHFPLLKITNYNLKI